MKKVILSAAALLIGAVSFAQVAGAPTSQVVSALPGAAATANAGESIQNGNANKVQVRQAGTNQSVYTYQDDGALGGGNLARVFQTGDVSDPSGVENAAEVLQSGDTNQSTTIQQGDYNNAYTAQGQNDGGNSVDNKARIQQGNNEQAESNYAAVEQDGARNEASTLQRWDNNDAWTVQSGDDNKSMVDQAAAPDGSDGHEAYTNQDGNRNGSTILQSGAGARNVATTEQLGDDNDAKQVQSTNATAGMTGNRAGIAQGAGLDLSNTPLVTSLFGELTNADPEALPVYGTPFPGAGASAFQTQNGKENEADVFQFGGTVGASNYSEQDQAFGWGNDAAVIQGHYYTGETSNYAKQYQGGDNNIAGLGQSGSGMKGVQTQIGHRNEALSNQRGAGHLLNVHQRGNDNRGITGQGGESNSTLLVQRDGQSYTAAQNLNLSALDRSAGGNQIDVLQLGPNGDFSADAINCDFDMPMDPMVIPEVPGFDLGEICPD
jgi:hypothetical protein